MTVKQVAWCVIAVLLYAALFIIHSMGGSVQNMLLIIGVICIARIVQSI
jgi:hypothetical protein